jgi:hypothetical protein
LIYRDMADQTNRREFVKAAVATGGSAALAACTTAESGSEGSDESGAAAASDGPEYPRGGNPSTLPQRQHAWDAFVVRDTRNNTVLPRHHVLLLLPESVDLIPPRSSWKRWVRTPRRPTTTTP